ncbi:MAG: hypothetical protein ACXQTL_08685 [Methanosarcinales archaeon]
MRVILGLETMYDYEFFLVDQETAVKVLKAKMEDREAIVRENCEPTQISSFSQVAIRVKHNGGPLPEVHEEELNETINESFHIWTEPDPPNESVTNEEV